MELDDSKGDFGALEGKKDEFSSQKKDQFDLLIQLLNTGVFSLLFSSTESSIGL